MAQPKPQTKLKPLLTKLKHRVKTLARRSVPVAKRAIRFSSTSSIPTILLVWSLLFARYIPNSDFSYPTEITLPLVLFAILATIVFYGYRRIFRGKSNPAHVASFLLIYALYGFNYAFPYVQKWTDAVLPSSLTTSFSSALTRILLLAFIFWAIAYAIDWLVRHVKQLHQVQPYKVLLFAICFIFAVQAFKLGTRLWTIADQWSYHPTATLPAKPDQPVADGSKPNVYYLLFDRYASTDTLRDTYKFDNTPMLDFFASQGFVGRDQAYANYPFTQQSVSSTLSMGYLTDLGQRFKGDASTFQTAFPYRSIISDPPVAQVFKQNGYQYNQVSSWWDFTRVGVKADNDPTKSFRLRLLGMTFWLTDLQRDIVHKSAFSPLLQKGFTVGSLTFFKYDQDRNPRQNFLDQMTAIKNIAAASDKQSKPNFTFAHVLAPHDPYLFAADGSEAKYNGDRTDQDIDEYVKYTNQLTYANTRIQEVIASIRANDPDAVVIFQPDEGPYPKQFRGALSEEHYFDPKDLSDAGMRHKFGITASYYMPGISPETIKQQLTSSVNVFPFVLNNYLGYDISYLPECNFSAGNKFVLYDYTQLTGKLRGEQDPASCKQYQ